MSDAASLSAVQAWFQDAVTAPRGPASLVPLAGTEAFPAAAGLGVYRRAYAARTAAAMRTQFPALCHKLGRTLFDDFAAGYLRRHPPASYTLHDLGRRFAGYLGAERPDRDAPEAWVDFMIELAQFERIVFELFDCPGAEGMTPARADTPDDALRLQPALRLATFSYNVAAYHHAVRREEPPPPPAKATQHVVVLRADYVVRTIALRAWEYEMLRTIADGNPVDTAAWPHVRDAWIALGLFVEV